MSEGQASAQVRFFTVEEESAGQRVDNFLAARLKGVPRSHIYRILRRGEVRVNRGRIRPDYRLQVGDQVRVPPLRLAERPPAAAPGRALRRLLEEAVLYEDRDLLVVDKPAGLAVHGGSGVSLGLIEALRAARDEPGLELVHRLDRETSGCLLVARRRAALRHLQRELRERRVEKVYLALVEGSWPRGLEEVSAPLERILVGEGERRVRPSRAGKAALTRFRVRRRLPEATLVEAQLETGRTHQIRIHCRIAGCPILGDEKYGRAAVNRAWRERGLRRLFLHAARLAFELPGEGGRLEVESPLPADLREVLSP